MKFRLILVFFVVLFFSLACFAQPGGGPPPDPGQPVPIGGLEILMFIGGILGIRRMSKK